MVQPLPPCGLIVKEHDPDRFLLSLFASPSRRPALWALFAFNHEIAKTREVVSETQLGLIRLQWWRDHIEKIYQGEPPPAHDILEALSEAIKAYDLPREDFDALLYAREFDLEDMLPSTLEGTINYADFTSTPLLRLALRVCGDDPASEPVETVATGYALAGLLRSVLFHARQKRCYLPEAVLTAHGVNIQKLYDLKSQDALKEVVRTVSGHIVEGVSVNSRMLKAFHVLSKIYKKQLRRVHFDLYHPRMRLEPPFKALRLYVGTNFL